MGTVRFPYKARFSGAALAAALEAAGYDGPDIDFGFMEMNKREQLCKLDAEGVPTLLLYAEPDLTYFLPVDQIPFPIVGRPDTHHGGQWLKVFRTESQLMRYGRRQAGRQWITHWQRWIDEKEEFRVHIVNGKSIKISRKEGGGNHRTGARFVGGVSADDRETLRELAKRATSALGASRGAVDILRKGEGDCCVLEVNAAPKLTDEHSDTLERYVRAFMVYE